MMLWMMMVAGIEPLQWVNLAFAALCFAGAIGANGRLVMVASGLLYLAVVMM